MFSLHVNSLLLWENRFYFLFIQDALVFFIPSFKVIIPQWSYKHQTLLSVLPQPAWFLRLYFFSVFPANKQEAPGLSSLPCILISTHHDDWYTSRRWTLVKEWLRYLVKILRPENTCLDGRKPWQTLCCLQSTHHLPQKSQLRTPWSALHSLPRLLLQWKTPPSPIGDIPVPLPIPSSLWYLTFSLLWIKSACVHIFTVWRNPKTHTGVWCTWTSLCDWS